MDYEKLAIGLIKYLRGNKSQHHFSSLLGYEFNIVHRWENGTKRIFWRDFVDVCKLTRVPVEKIVEDVYEYSEGLEREEHFLSFIIRDKNIKKIAKELKMSSNTLYNCLNGKSRAQLSLVLCLLDHLALFKLDEFMERFCTPDFLSTFFPSYLLTKDFNSVSIRDPQMALLIATLELNHYKDLSAHSDTVLAKLLGISEQAVKTCLSFLEEKGFIKFEDDKYVSERDGGMISINNYSEEDLLSLDEYWSREVFKYYRKTPVEDREFCRRGFLRLTFDDESIKEFDNLFMDFYLKAQDIAAKTKKNEMIRVINMNYFNPLHEN